MSMPTPASFVDRPIIQSPPRGEAPLPYGVDLFVNQTKHEAPWGIPHAFQPASTVGNHGSFTSYRSPPVAHSEYGLGFPHGMSDSGYGTRRPSIGNPSVYSAAAAPDRSLETQSLTGHFDNIHFPESKPKYVCETCGEMVKTRSDLK
jgi:hypothetical protein